MDLAEFSAKLYNLFGMGQKLPKDSRENICQKYGIYRQKKHEHGGCEKWNYAQRPIRPWSSKDFKTTHRRSIQGANNFQIF